MEDCESLMWVQSHAKAFPYFTRFISGLKIKLHASRFNMFPPWAWKFGWGSAQDFTANSFWKELCVYFIPPNSCFAASREEREGRARMGEMILIPREALTRENRNWTERPRQTDIRSETVPTVARSERRKRVGGIKQLTCTALWGMWVPLTTASLPNKQALSWQCKTNTNVSLISGAHVGSKVQK